MQAPNRYSLCQAVYGITSAVFPLLIFLPAALCQAPAAPDRYSYTIQYTGRLLGYTRIPNVQLFNLANPPPDPMSRLTQNYLNELDKSRVKDVPRYGPRLGMGDNFS